MDTYLRVKLFNVALYGLKVKLGLLVDEASAQLLVVLEEHLVLID